MAVSLRIDGTKVAGMFPFQACDWLLIVQSMSSLVRKNMMSFEWLARQNQSFINWFAISRGLLRTKTHNYWRMWGKECAKQAGQQVPHLIGQLTDSLGCDWMMMCLVTVMGHINIIIGGQPCQGVRAVRTNTSELPGAWLCHLGPMRGRLWQGLPMRRILFVIVTKNLTVQCRGLVIEGRRRVWLPYHRGLIYYNRRPDLFVRDSVHNSIIPWFCP